MKKILLSVSLGLMLINQLNACRSPLHCFGCCKDLNRIERFEAERNAIQAVEEAVIKQEAADRQEALMIAAIAAAEAADDARAQIKYEKQAAYELCKICTNPKPYTVGDGTDENTVIFHLCGEHMCGKHEATDSMILLRLSVSRIQKMGPHSINILVQKFKTRPAVLARIQDALNTNELNLSHLELTNANLRDIVLILLAIELNKTLRVIDLSGNLLTRTPELLNERNFPKLLKNIIIDNDMVLHTLRKHWSVSSKIVKLTPRVLTPLQEISSGLLPDTGTDSAMLPGAALDSQQ